MNENTQKSRRSKGDGSLFKTENGTWIARYRKKGVPTKQFSGKTKAEAKAKMDQYRFLVESGQANYSSATLEEYAEKFLYHKRQQVGRKKFKQSSYDRLEATYLSHIQTHSIAKVKIKNLTSYQIQLLIDEMQHNYSYSTIKKAYLFISSMLSYGKICGDFSNAFNPLTNVELPDESAVGVTTKEIETLDMNKIEAFKNEAMRINSDGSFVHRYGPALVLMLNTGVREGELLAISRHAIIQNQIGRNLLSITETISVVKNREPNSKKNYVTIITAPKYPRSVRLIPLNKEAEYCYNIMAETFVPSSFRGDLLITTSKGNMPTRQNLQRSLDQILRNIGHPHCGTHALRHTFATTLLAKTSTHQEMKAVAELMGDDYKVLVKTYLHTTDTGKCDLVDRLQVS